MTTRRMRNIDSEIVDTHTRCCSTLYVHSKYVAGNIRNTHTHAKVAVCA